MSYTLNIPGETMSLKNSKQIARGRGFTKILPSKAYRSWADASMWILNQNELVGHQWVYPVTIDFHFYRKTKRAFDYINLGQGPLDVMIAVGILAEDDMNHVIPGRWAWNLDKENPRVEITIIDGL